MRKRVLAVCCVCAMFLFIIGCGDSSSSVSGNGVFADAPVVGLSYSCSGQTAVTGTGGTFSCPTGSTVTFSVGGINLCSITAQPFITPVSCAQATNSSANTSTPSVVAMARFLQSISTTPASSGTLTITSAELQAAAGLSLNFATATDAQLQTAVNTVRPGATLVDAATAQAQLLTTVNAGVAGTYKGTYSGASSGSWTLTIDSTGKVSGSATDGGGTAPVSGSLASGTTFTGTAASANWIGTLNTSQTPFVFSGTWSNGSTTGTFTGTKQ